MPEFRLSLAGHFRSIILAQNRGASFATRIVRVTPERIQRVDEINGHMKVYDYEVESGNLTVDGIQQDSNFKDIFLGQLAAMARDARDSEKDTDVFIEPEERK